MKRTYQPKKKQKNRQHGFLKRMSSAKGILTLARRRLKGRWSIAQKGVRIKHSKKI